MRRLLGMGMIVAILVPLVLGGILVTMGRQAWRDTRVVADARFAAIDTQLQDIDALLVDVGPTFAESTDALAQVSTALDEAEGFVQELRAAIPGWLSFLLGIEEIFNSILGSLQSLTDAVASLIALQAVPEHINNVLIEADGLLQDIDAVVDQQVRPMWRVASVLGVWLAGVYIALVWQWLARGWAMLVGKAIDAEAA